MSNQDLVDYCTAICRYPLLSKTEERELLEAAAAGDKNAREKLITHNLRLVVSVANQYAGPGTDIMDLIQQGSLGLMYAIDHYDLERGAALSTVATYGIKKFIMKWFFEQSRTIRRPQWQQEVTSKIREAERVLGEKATDASIAEYLDLPVSTIEQVRRENEYRFVSLDTRIGESEDTLADLIAAEPETNNDRFARAVEVALGNVSEEDASLLRRRFGIGNAQPVTLDQLAEERGCSREYIRQLEDAALRRLRHPDILRKIRKEL